MNKDTVVGILGAVILVAAIIGIITYESSLPAASGTGPTPGGGGGMQFNVSAADGPTLASQGAQAEGTTQNGTVLLNQTNITKVEFTLTWTDDTANSAPDTFDLIITSPEGKTFHDQQSGGSAKVVFSPLNPVPNGTAMTGRVGTGTWRIQVHMVDAGDVGPTPPVPPPAPVPNVTDTGNAWSLTTKVSTYKAG